MIKFLADNQLFEIENLLYKIVSRKHDVFDGWVYKIEAQYKNKQVFHKTEEEIKKLEESGKIDYNVSYTRGKVDFSKLKKSQQQIKKTMQK